METISLTWATDAYVRDFLGCGSCNQFPFFFSVFDSFAALTADNSQANPTGNTTVTQSEAVDYIHFLAGIATGLNMTIGLKNSLQLLSSVSSVISFAVNEQCAFYQECYWYQDLIAAGKPVYQIEYPTPIPPSPSARASTCAATPPTPSGLSLVFKNLSLDGYVVYCDGSIFTTDTKPGDAYAPPPRSSARPHPTTTIPWSSSPPSTTPTYGYTSPKSSIMPSTPASSPTSQPGGCTSKHWDQCGGKNWNGCTVCAVCIILQASLNYAVANFLLVGLNMQIFESILFTMLNTWRKLGHCI